MGNYLKGNTPGAIYKQLLSIGQAADQAGLTATLKPVWTDDGGTSANLAPFQLSTAALSFNTTKQLQFRDTALYLYSSTDGQLDIVADGEVQIATARFDVNATDDITIDTTDTSQGIKIGETSGVPIVIGHTTSETTISDNLTVTGTTALNGVATVASGVKLQFVDGNEYISGNSTDITVGSSGDINLTATSDVNLPSGVGLTFGADTEKIEGTGSNVLALVAGGALNITGAAASTWKTSSGAITIDSEAAAVTVDGHGGVNIAGTNGSEVDITTTGALDLNSAGFTLDASTMSIDGTDDSNITVTGSNKDLTISVVGGSTQKLTLSSAGTGADSMSFTSTAGGIDLLSTGGTSDIDIANTGGSVNISSTENVADAIVLNASAGGIDITSSGTAGEDIDITTSSSINLGSTENAANAIYLHANGGTSETIKIHSDQGTGDDSIYVLSDAGGISIESGKTGAITNMASDSSSSLTNAVIRIGTDTANCDIAIGNGTSDVHFGDNVKIAGDLHVVGSVPSANSLSAGTIARFTITNTDEENTAGGRDSEILFKGELGDGTAHELGAITTFHQGSSADMHGSMVFRLNDSTSGASLTAVGGADDVLTLTYDKTATFAGAVTAGTNAVTCGQLNADNVRLDGNTITTQDTDGDLTITPNGNGGIIFFTGTASGNDAIAWNGATASGASAFAGGGAGTSSGDNSFNWGSNTVSAAGSAAFGSANAVSGALSFSIGQNAANAGTNSLTSGYSCDTTTGVSGQVALGYQAKSRHQGQIALSSGTVTGSTEGSSQASIIHTSEAVTLNGTNWITVDGGSGAFTFESDTVVMAQTLIVMTLAGAATTVGFKIEWLGQNDGGTENLIASTVTEFVSEDGTLAAQVAVSGDTFVIQVRDDTGSNTGTYAVSCVTTWSQVTYA
tara:strand:+ start:3278 stop:6010 length:2733 start_codon:yes stop_codon:yes gene_type:complete